VLLRIVIDHLDAIARGMRNEDPTRSGIERGMVELAVLAVRNCDDAKRSQRRDVLTACCGSGRSRV
jgi:hypothetical protein